MTRKPSKEKAPLTPAERVAYAALLLDNALPPIDQGLEAVAQLAKWNVVTQVVQAHLAVARAEWEMTMVNPFDNFLGE